MDVKRITFDGAGVTIVGDATGPADGPPILFLHGGGQTRQSWARAAAEAGRRGYRALTMDLRGHGESDWAPGGVYSMDLFAGDVRGVVATLARPPVLVGASLGGLTSLLVAADPPPAIAALVLVDIATRIEDEGRREIGAFMSSGLDGFASLDEAADAVAAYLPHRPRPSDTSGLLKNLRLRQDGRYYWHWDPAFVRRPEEGDDAGHRPDLFEDAARRLRLPTLLVRGGRSRVLSVTGAQAFLELVPQAAFVDVEGADHMVAGDANDSFNAAVFDFLDRHVPVATAP